MDGRTSKSTPLRGNTISRLVALYAKKNQQNPLGTKAATLVVLSFLNEQIASYVSGDTKQAQITLGGRKFTVSHALTSKVPLMAAFALLVNAPFNHYAYKLLQRPFGGTLTPAKRALQTLLACVTLTPTFAVLFVGWIATINSTNWLRIYSLLRSRDTPALKKELMRTWAQIVRVFKASYWAVLRNSWIGTPLFTTLAQSFVPNEMWASFFALCYFVLGTYNNTRVKMQKKQE